MTPEQEQSLRQSLRYLGEHIGLLESWCRRGDTHPGLVRQTELVRAQFNSVMEKLPPADQKVESGQ
jgi:hypothetical protein